jgi:starch-binding outer membrane protein, SusD/RagB family
MHFSRMTGLRRTAAAVALAALAVAATACESITEPLLEATDPDIINPADVRDADGAEAVRVGALQRLAQMTSAAEGPFFFGGMLADEWKSGDTFQQRQETDKRQVDPSNTLNRDAYRFIHRARLQSTQAIDLLRQYRPSERAKVAQMFWVMGYAVTQSAENYCNGQPFSSVNGQTIVEGAPITSKAAFALAVSHFDSALAVLGADTDTLSVRIRRAALVGRARALLGQGLADSAGRAVTAVPTTWVYEITHSQTTVDNQIWALNNSALRYVVPDTTEPNVRNILPYISARDPRLPVQNRSGNAPNTNTDPAATLANITACVNAVRAFDGVTCPATQQLKWPTRDASVAISSGIEARLIEAEGLYKADPNDAVGYLGKLNALRTTVPGLAPLADPGTPAGRIDLIMRERAFWMFGTGHRLGDMRRLIRDYGRTQDQVFPVGPFHQGGVYGTDVNLPVPQAEQNNSKFQGCTDRNA